jgi:hypothetical protein
MPCETGSRIEHGAVVNRDSFENMKGQSEPPAKLAVEQNRDSDFNASDSGETVS